MIKWLVLAAVLIALGVILTPAGAFNVVFGWVPFLGRVTPNLTVDVPTVFVGTTALVLFALLVHRLGRAFHPWKVRWTVALVCGIVILFAAGVAVVGMTHQVAWLATSEVPLKGETLDRNDRAPINTAKMIGLGIANNVDDFSGLPSGGTFSKEGQMLHSWETQILPYLSYSLSGVAMDRPWNDPVNQQYYKGPLSGFINPGFRTPALEDRDGYGLSHYACNRRVMAANTAMKPTNIRDGTSNTIAIGEVNANFQPWGHPVNWRDPAIGLNSPRGFGGPPGANGVHFVMADGSVRFIRNNVDPAVLRALSTPRGGEAVPDSFD